MSVYTVKNVLDRKEWSGNYGPMVTYVLDVEDENGSFSPKVELNRKPESREPQSGERFVGHLEETNFAEKLKIDFEATKELNKGTSYEASTGTSGGSQSVSKGQKGDVDWDCRNAEIRRQHSQEMTLRLITSSQFTLAAENAKAVIADWADWFDQDAIEAGQKYGQKASQGAGAAHKDGGSPTPSSVGQAFSPPPEKSSADERNLQEYGELLDNAGLTVAAARDKVSEYMGLVLPAARLTKALSGLQDLDRQGNTLAQLKKETEDWIGGPLPQGDALDGDESIPF